MKAQDSKTWKEQTAHVKIMSLLLHIWVLWLYLCTTVCTRAFQTFGSILLIYF